MRMDGAALVAACKAHRLYQTPALNDHLYANFRGFTALGGLEPYTGLRALFLEGNALESPEGLPPLPELRCLFLQQNGLTSLAAPTLARLPQLDTLNVGGNALGSLEGLEGCAALRTLVASDNCLGPSLDAVAPLAACAALESVDLSGNRLKDGEGLLALLASLPHLKCLYLRGNPAVSALRSYRKAAVAALPALTYLDDRPVSEEERLCAEAWARGGLDAEREARAAYRQREQEREARQVAALRELREAGWRKRREELGLDPEGGDPWLEGVPAEPEVEEEEPAELRQARERLAALSTGRQEDAGLAEADVQAVLEDARANKAQLLQGGQASSSPRPLPPRENSCPNNSVGGGGGSSAAAAACGVPERAAGIPAARVTVHIGSWSAGAVAEQEVAAAGGEAAAGKPLQAAVVAAGEEDDELDALD